jgi:hypothetical protein
MLRSALLFFERLLDKRYSAASPAVNRHADFGPTEIARGGPGQSFRDDQRGVDRDEKGRADRPLRPIRPPLEQCDAPSRLR